MAIATFRRYEKKYLLTLTQYQTLLPSLEKHMGLDSYCENGEDYEIYSLYYDTKHHDLIRHSLSHPYYKEKLRVRSYRIPRSQQEPVFVELEKKDWRRYGKAPRGAPAGRGLPAPCRRCAARNA